MSMNDELKKQMREKYKSEIGNQGAKDDKNQTQHRPLCRTVTEGGIVIYAYASYLPEASPKDQQGEEQASDKELPYHVFEYKPQEGKGKLFAQMLVFNYRTEEERDEVADGTCFFMNKLFVRKLKGKSKL